MAYNKTIVKKIICDIIALFVITVICYFIFKEKVIYSMIAVFSFAITIGLLRAREIVSIALNQGKATK